MKSMYVDMYGITLTMVAYNNMEDVYRINRELGIAMECICINNGVVLGLSNDNFQTRCGTGNSIGYDVLYLCVTMTGQAFLMVTDPARRRIGKYTITKYLYDATYLVINDGFIIWQDVADFDKLIEEGGRKVADFTDGYNETCTHDYERIVGAIGFDR